MKVNITFLLLCFAAVCHAKSDDSIDFKATSLGNIISTFYYQKLDARDFDSFDLNGGYSSVNNQLNSVLNDGFHTSLWPKDPPLEDPGFLVGKEGDEYKVTYINQKSEAYLLGLKRGDTILSINSKHPKNIMDFFVPKNKAFTLSFWNGSFKIINLTSKSVEISSLANVTIHKDNVYIDIAEFSEDTVQQVLDAIPNEKYHDIYVDLRFNRGGHLDSMRTMLEAFRINSEFTIVSLSPQFKNVKLNKVISNKNFKFDKIYVFVSNNTISAAELFAGRIKESKHGILYGSRTYGAVQGSFYVTVSDKFDLKIAMTDHLLNDGSRISGVGVTPDFLFSIPLKYTLVQYFQLFPMDGLPK